MQAKRKKKVTKGGRPNRRKKNQEVIMSSHVNHMKSVLYSTIRESSRSLVVTVADWLAEYKNDQSTAFLELVQMIFNCCGCQKELTMHIFTHDDAAYVVNSMSDGFDLEPDNIYPMVSLGNQGKKFSNTLIDFFQELVSQTKNSLLFDGFLMTRLIDILVCLSSSGIRAFRHTATFIALKLQTALIDVYIELLQRRCVVRKQLEAAQAPDKNTSYNHIEMLEVQLNEYTENVQEVGGMVRILTMSCFVPRIRDVMHEIRILAISEVSEWIMKLPESFHDSVKYIKFIMYDQHGPARVTALQTLKLLVEQDSLKLLMSPLLNMVKCRLIDMTLDKELNVNTLAIDILTTIKKRHANTVALTLEDCVSVCGFMYSKHRLNARAAGLFYLACHQDFHLEDSETDEEGNESDANNDDSYAIEGKALLRNLIAFHLHATAKMENPKIIGLLVDALIDTVPFMTDWRIISNLLLEVLRDDQQYVLVNILAYSVKQVVNREPPLGRLPSKKQQTARELKQCNKDRARMTEHFIDTLPKLLKVHQGDSRKKTQLLSIALQMDLKMYLTLQKDNALKSLLKTVAKIVVHSTDDEELEMCARVLCNFQLFDYGHTDLFIGIIKRHLMEEYNAALDNWKNKEENITEDETHQFTACIQRVAIMSSAFPLFVLENAELELLHEILEDATEEGCTFDLETYIYAIKASYFYLLYKAKALETSTSDVNEPEMKFLIILKQLLSDPSIDVKLKTMAFNAACDTLLINQVRSDTEEFNRYLHTLSKFLAHSMKMPRKDGAKDWNKTKLLITFWRLLLNGIAPAAFTYVYLDNFFQMNEVYTESINDLFTSLWQSDKESCTTLIISGLKALLLKYLRKAEGCDRLSQRFLQIMEVTKRAVNWLNLGKSNAAQFSSQLLQILKTKLPWNMDTDQMPFFEMMAQFTTKLVPNDRAKLLQEVNANLPEKLHISLQVFINSLSGNTMPGLGNKPRAVNVHATTGKQLKPKKTRRLAPLEVIITPHRGPAKRVAPTPASFTSAVITHSSTPRQPQANSTQLEIETGPFNNTDISRLSAIELSSCASQLSLPSSTIDEEMDFEDSTVLAQTINVGSEKSCAKVSQKQNKVTSTKNKSGIDSFNPLTPLLEEESSLQEGDGCGKISQHHRNEENACVRQASSLTTIAQVEVSDYSVSGDLITNTSTSYLKNKITKSKHSIKGSVKKANTKSWLATSSNIQALLLDESISQNQENFANSIRGSSSSVSPISEKSQNSMHGSNIVKQNLKKGNAHVQRAASIATTVEAEELDYSMDGSVSPISAFLRVSKHSSDGSANNASRKSCSLTSSNLSKMLVDDDISFNITQNQESSTKRSNKHSSQTIMTEEHSGNSKDKEVNCGSYIVLQLKEKGKTHIRRATMKGKARVATGISIEESDQSSDTDGNINSIASNSLKDVLRQRKHSKDGSVNNPLSKSSSVISSNLGNMLKDDNLSGNIPPDQDFTSRISSRSSSESMMEVESDSSRDEDNNASSIIPQIEKNKMQKPRVTTNNKVRVAVGIEAEESDRSLETEGKASSSITSNRSKEIFRQSKHSNDGSVNNALTKSGSVTSSKGKMLVDYDLSGNIHPDQDFTNSISSHSSPESMMEDESDGSRDDEGNDSIMIPQIETNKIHLPRSTTKGKAKVAIRTGAEESDRSIETEGKASSSITSNRLKEIFRQSKHSNDGSVNNALTKSCSLTSSNLGKMLVDYDLSGNIHPDQDFTNPISSHSSPESMMEDESDGSRDDEGNDSIMIPQIEKNKMQKPRATTNNKVRVAVGIEAEESDRSIETEGKASSSITSNRLKEIFRQSKHSNDGSVNNALTKSCSVVDYDLSGNIHPDQDFTNPISSHSSPESMMEDESDGSRDDEGNDSIMIPQIEKNKMQKPRETTHNKVRVAVGIEAEESDRSIETEGKASSSITSNRLKEIFRQSKHSNDGSVNNALTKSCSVVDYDLSGNIHPDQDFTNPISSHSSPESMMEDESDGSRDDEGNDSIMIPQIETNKIHLPRSTTKGKAKVAIRTGAEESDRSIETVGKASSSIASNRLKEILRQSKHSNDGSVNTAFTKSCSVTSSHLGKMLVDDYLSGNIHPDQDFTNPISSHSSPESMMEDESDGSRDDEGNDSIMIPQIEKNKIHLPRSTTKGKAKVAIRTGAEESDRSIETVGKASSITSSHFKDISRQRKHSNDGSVNSALSKSCSVTSSHLGTMLVDDDDLSDITQNQDFTNPISSPEDMMEVESDSAMNEENNSSKVSSKIVRKGKKARVQRASSIATTIATDKSDHSMDMVSKVSSIASNRSKDFLTQNKNSNDDSANNAYSKSCSVTSSNFGKILVDDSSANMPNNQESSSKPRSKHRSAFMTENNSSIENTINNCEKGDCDNESIASSLMIRWEKDYKHLDKGLNNTEKNSVTTKSCEGSNLSVIMNKDELGDSDDSAGNTGTRAGSTRSNSSALFRQSLKEIVSDSSTSDNSSQELEEPNVGIRADVNSTSNNLEDNHDQENTSVVSSEKSSHLGMKNTKKQITEKVDISSLFGEYAEPAPSEATSGTVSSPAFSTSTATSKGRKMSKYKRRYRDEEGDSVDTDSLFSSVL